MKTLFHILIFFIVISCSNDKVVYWCGDHPCANKKEREAYFKKTMTVEIKKIRQENAKENSEIEKILQQAKQKVRVVIKDEKALAKQVKLDEKRRLKEEKALAKQTKVEERKIIKKENVTPKQSSNIDEGLKNTSISSTDFKKIVEKITKENAFKPYPDINNMPN